MPYCTVEDMTNRFGEQELIDLSAPGQSQIDIQVLNQAISDAQAEIDGYVSARYQLPLSPVPTVLIRLSCNIARYYLYNDQVTDLVEKAYKDAIRFLVDIGKGRVQLGVNSLGESASQSASLAEMTGDKTVWKRSDSSGFI